LSLLSEFRPPADRAAILQRDRALGRDGFVRIAVVRSVQRKRGAELAGGSDQLDAPAAGGAVAADAEVRALAQGLEAVVVTVEPFRRRPQARVMHVPSSRWTIESDAAFGQDKTRAEAGELRRVAVGRGHRRRHRLKNGGIAVVRGPSRAGGVA